ncbi:MAG: SUMF1/EgtB/PvdO family nonheme iron enzyme [Bacteroidaceae bacterium]|nr:SUMF1/EgtB/PvdO family nonheme iron enzyme [Bacteroidaceae bacterium]
MRNLKTIFFTLLLLLVGAVSSFGQLKFHVASFGEDQFDLAARDERFKKIDGSGSLYAIIKVSGDDLKEYNFNFGNMNHLVESHEDQLWVYVQKNAKHVTITRSGYTPLRNYDLRTTIEAGKTYVMQLSAQGPVIYTQMVMFQTEPKVTGAVVMVQREGGDSPKELFGTTDVTGVAAKGLEFGTYTYEVMAENYYSSEGRFTLNNQNETHRENVMLRSNGANITLAVATNADIYINGTKKGTRSWTGSLKAGLHNVECRQENHRLSSQTISVKEGEDQSIVLAPPTPITGVLAITSTPSGAAIHVDGKAFGTTPRNITDLLIGQHTVTLSLGGYNDAQSTVEIKEQQTTDLSLALTEGANNAGTPVNTSLPKENKTFTVNGVSFVMVPVEGGTFQMGATTEQISEAFDDEKPVHNVTLSSYYIGQTEITQALWQAVMGTNPSERKIDIDLPVENVSWDDCQEFISKLNELAGQKFRLPTEAEWEYAARGGNSSKGYIYSGSNKAKDVAWYGRFMYRTQPVKKKRPNELGLYDMSGNVFEWCQDWYGSYSSLSQTNPVGPTSGTNRVIRGGSTATTPIACRVAYRDSATETFRGNLLGLRLALSE